MFPLSYQRGEVTAPHRVTFAERQLAALPEGHVLVKVRASALCGSDLHIFRGRHPSAPLPVTIGHEFAGDVVAIGEGSDAAWLGQRVTVEPCVPCGHCEACLRGAYGHCAQLTFLYRTGDGAMAPYVPVPQRCLYPLPDSLSYEVGALIEPLAVAVHAVRRAGVALGSEVLIVGAGAIGLCVTALCRHAGAARVVTVDPQPGRREAALALGATDALAPDVPLPGSFTHAFECVGREATLVAALHALVKGGLLTVVGIFEDRPKAFPVDLLVTRELRMQGAQGYCWDFDMAIALAGPLSIGRLITHRFPLASLQAALEACENPAEGVIKALILP